MIPVSPTDHMELREGSNEDDDFEECVDEVDELIPTLEEDHVVPNVEDLVIEEVTDLEEGLHDSDIPHSKHIKKSNSEEDNVPKSVHDDNRVAGQNPFSESEASAKPSEGFTAERTGMSQ